MKIAFSRVSLSALGMTANADDLFFELRDPERCGVGDVWEGEHGGAVTFGGVDLDQQQADAHGRRLVAIQGVVMDALCSGALRAFVGGDGLHTYRLPADYWCTAQSFLTYSPPDESPWPVEMAGERVVFVDAEMRSWARTAGRPDMQDRLGAEASTRSAAKLRHPSSLHEEDAPLIEEMKRLIEDGKASGPNPAALIVADRATGASLDARVRRLERRYLSIYGAKSA